MRAWWGGEGNIPLSGPIGLFSDLVSDHYRASAPRPAPPLRGHVTGIIQNISLMCINTKTGQLPAPVRPPTLEYYFRNSNFSLALYPDFHASIVRAFELWSALICCRQFIFLLNNFHAKPLPWGLSPEVNSLFLSGLQKIEKETNKIVPELFFGKHNIFRETNLIKKFTLFISL